MRLDDTPFRTMPLFAGVPDDRLERLAGRFEERTAIPGTLLTAEGASGYGFFVVLEGQADVHVGDRQVGTLGPGDYFGEVALLGHGGRRMAAVTAGTPMRLASMFGTEFRQMENDTPEVIERLRATMNERLEIAGLPPE